jgi:hypothetical protein
MSPRMVVATIASLLAVAAAAGGVVAGTGRPLAVGLFATAGVLAATAVALVIAAARQARRLRARRRAAVDSPLLRLEYLPSVTSRVPLLRWRGSRYWSIGGRASATPTEEPAERELIGVRQVTVHQTGDPARPERSEGG